MTEYKPLRLYPCYKEYLWGGTRLKKEFGKTDAPDVTAESWELAELEAGCSLTGSGESLSQLASQDREKFWGSSIREDQFPVLVKMIDAAKDLSIQVHPSDETAIPRLGEQGKAEMWYIVDCRPGAFLYYGFSKKIRREEFVRRAKDGTICDVLNRVPVHPGDVFYILPGTIHAIGAGTLIAEIQQSSNTTFRVYDYGRLDAHGNPRALHLDRAAEFVDLTPVLPERCRANNSFETPDFTFSEMFRCRYFSAYCIQVRREIPLVCDGSSFHHLLCVDGSGEIQAGQTLYPIERGQSYFLPAAMGAYRVRGKCRVLLSKR